MTQTILIRRDHAHPSYLVVTATQDIPAGASVRVDHATGTASLHYQPEALDQ